MSLNKNKVLANAQKYVQRGAFDKAIREYQRLLEEDPKDVRTLLRIGDLHARRGDSPSAARTYERVALTYSEQGFYQKSVAVYKQILKVDPAQVEINQKLAELYQQLGLLSNAMEQYQVLAAHYDRQGRSRETIGIYQRLVQMDPENVASRVKLAELFSRENRTEDSVVEFEKACEQLILQSRQDDYIKVAERLLFLDPSKLGETRRLAKVYLDRGDTKRALAKLQVCFKAEPRDLETLTHLAETFRALGQLPKSVSVWKELAKIYREKGLHKEHDRTWERVLEVMPDDADAREALSSPRPATAPAEVLSPERGGAPVPERSVSSGSASASTIASTGRPPATNAELDKLLAEADTYIDYGLFQKAREHLDRVFRQSPRHAGALERQLKVAERMGDGKSAATALAGLALHRPAGSPAQRDMLERALRSDPGNASALRVLDELGLPVPVAGSGSSAARLAPTASPATRPAHPPSDAPSPGSTMELVGAGGEEIIIVDDDDQEEEVDREETVFGLPPGFSLPERAMDAQAASRSLVADATALSQGQAASGPDARVVELVPGAVAIELDLESLDGEELLEEADEDAFADEAALDLALGALDEQPGQAAPWERAGEAPEIRRAGRSAEVAAPPVPARVEPLLVGVEHGLGSLDDLNLDTGAFALPEAGERTMIAALPPEFLGQGGGGASPLRSDAEVAGQLEEAEFFIEQGLLEEARLILEELARQRPLRQDIAARYAEIGKNLAPQEPLPVDGAEEVVLDEYFEELSAVEEPPLSPEDAETHYDLGIAYKEMGLFDDAIGEFSQAMRSVVRELNAIERIGACLLEKRHFDDAIREFKRGLASVRLTDAAALDFYFGLGSAYDGLGDEREALYYYRRVHAAMKEYRDVSQRVARLGAAAAVNDGLPPAVRRPG